MHIMVVRQTSSGRRNSKVSILWQDNVLRADTHLKVLFVVRHPVVEENCQGVLEVLNLGSHRERLISEVSEATCQLLSGTIVLVVKVFGAIVGHGHDVGIVVLVVIVKAVKK